MLLQLGKSDLFLFMSLKSVTCSIVSILNEDASESNAEKLAFSSIASVRLAREGRASYRRLAV